jgi:hypothetical protein
MRVSSVEAETGRSSADGVSFTRDLEGTGALVVNPVLFFCPPSSPTNKPPDVL